ncbi:6981_t:CDS:10 [Ambispora gerdemannii]|uniref:Protein BZZ1 n=1 Tax=Ambispora gerdemannii TaxID=144530 RepID=A0A9N8YMY8_9GLOM|nr:6981_t:CDS:10 [Ambispora gerdemannii]
MKSFGSELKDQVTAVNQFVQSGIQFLNDIRDFIKERAQIEKDYAHKLETLAKKYASKKDKKSIALSVGENGLSSNQTEIGASFETSTFIKAWGRLLEEIENIAKDRHSLSEILSTAVVDRIKGVASKKEEFRKKHMIFAQKLVSDRDKIYAEKQKAKSRYDESCVEAQSSLQKQERAPDEKTLEKLKKQSIQDEVDMKNNKAANEYKKKYYHTDVPALIDHMQKLNESRIKAIHEIWNDYIGHELTVLSKTERHYNDIREALQKVDAEADSQLFIKYNKKEWDEPPDFFFEPSQAWEDNEELANDENAQVFLSNKLVKAKQRLTDYNSSIETKKKDISGMENLVDAYSKNPSLGNADVVNENLLETLREVTSLESMKTYYQTEVNSIIPVIGDISPEQKPHEFKSAAFTIPTNCDLCQASVWGIAKQGLTCKECGYNCHSKCEMKVPPNCTRKKGVINRGLVTSIAFSNPISPWGTLSSVPNYMSLAGASTPTSIQSTSTVVDQEVCLQATALYDYKAGGPSEISMRAGDTMVVLEPDDGSGWVQVLIDENSGLVPASYIEIENHEGIHRDYVRVLYDYKAQTAEELTIHENEIIQVTNRNIGDGWWEGIIDNQRGQFPAAYVEEYIG